MVITKCLFLASFMLASALASDSGTSKKPATAALLVQPNFDFSLTRDEFRVHYTGLGSDFASQESKKASIRIYYPDGTQALSYELKDKKANKAYHFALNDVKEGTYKVEVCEENVCSAKTPSLNNITLSGKHMLSCEQGNMVGGNWRHDPELPDIKVEFVGPSIDDWAKISDYTTFEEKVNQARRAAKLDANYETDYKKFELSGNPSFQKKNKIFHAAFYYDLTRYRQLFDKYRGSSDTRTGYVDDYCGRKFMLSVHSHLVNEATNEVEYRFKTVNYLSEGGKKVFILGQQGEKILLETTHKGVDIKEGTYKLWISLCVTDKDAIESTYCASPMKMDFEV